MWASGASGGARAPQRSHGWSGTGAGRPLAATRATALTVPMARTRRLLVTSAGAVVACLLAGCAQTSLTFNRDDNLGYTACRDLFASRLTDDDDRREHLLANAAASAAAADSPGIRATVSPPVDEDRLEQIGSEDTEYTVDEDALAAACEESGFNADDVELENPTRADG
jgi:hypothetical protein